MLVLGIKDRIVNSNCSTAAPRVSVYTWVCVRGGGGGWGGVAAFHSPARNPLPFFFLPSSQFSQLQILTVFLTPNAVWDRVMCF